MVYTLLSTCAAMLQRCNAATLRSLHVVVDTVDENSGPIDEHLGVEHTADHAGDVLDVEVHSRLALG